MNEPAGEATARQLRGSVLLLSGRLVALAVEFAAQVLVVRHLAKAEFGAYGFALAAAMLLSTLALAGLPETVARYAPIFRIRGEHAKVAGTLVVAAGVVSVVGSAAVLAVLALPGPVGDALGSQRAAALLAILVLLVPAEALNQVLQALFAAFGRARTIFLRQYVLVPGLRFTVAVLLVVRGEDATFLAAGYVLASAVGLLLYVAMLRPLLRGAAAPRRGELPVRELLSFSAPVFLTSLSWLSLAALSTLLLGVLAGTREVAEFQAVLQPARLNQLVTVSFAVLFVPTVAALYAEGRLGALRSAYMRTTYWLVALTFPILALTTVFASTFVPAVFGQRYESSSAVLAVLALGYFVHTAAGMNGSTLKVFRRLRWSVGVDVGSLVLAVVLEIVLIPAAGALGAALAVTIALAARNVLAHQALRRVAGVRLFTPEYVRLLTTVAGGLAALLALRLALDPGLAAATILCAAMGGAVVLASRRALDVATVFPALAGRRIGAPIRP